MRSCSLVPFAALTLASPALAAFPTHVFTPYYQIDAENLPNVSNMITATGQKYYTMAFIIPNSSGLPSWGGSGNISANDANGTRITAIRNAGGDAIISFGGASGGELAINAPDATTLANRYISVIDTYHATWLDFDIETNVLPQTSKNQLRNSALAIVQAQRPGTLISFTLPADTSGLDSDGKALLTDAKAKGLQIHDVNAMAMDYGVNLNGRSMATMATQTATAVHNNLASIDSSLPVGITIMLGQNDVTDEVFKLSDIAPLLTFANQNSWINHLAMWSANRDNGTSVNSSASDNFSGIVQNTWDFTNGFKSFSTAVPEPASLGLLAAGSLLLIRKSTKAR